MLVEDLERVAGREATSVQAAHHIDQSLDEPMFLLTRRERISRQGPEKAVPQVFEMGGAGRGMQAEEHESTMET